MREENKKIGKKIREARISNNLTQNELGKLIGKTGSAVGYLEAGLRKISPDTLKKIADTLNKPFKYFFDGEDSDMIIREKLMVIEKQFKDLSGTIKKIETEKFKFKEFYEDIFLESPHLNIFFNDEDRVIFFNNRFKKIFGSSKNDEVIKNLEKIIKSEANKNRHNIVKNIGFEFTLKKNSTKSVRHDMAFFAKSVYEKNGKYLGLWIAEKIIG